MPTMIYAHRGASHDAPENSMPAFALAIEQGADAIELDVQPSADGDVIVFHDPTLERLCGVERAVSSLTREALRRYDIRGSHTRYGSVRIPALAEVLDLLRPTSLHLNIEVKGKNRNPEFLRRILGQVADSGMGERIFYSAFDPPTLSFLGARAGRDKIAYLCSHGPPQSLMGLLRTRARIVHPRWHGTGTALHTTMLKTAGFGVNVWTVDAPAQLEQIFHLQLDGVITNRPDLALAIRRQYEGVFSCE